MLASSMKRDDFEAICSAIVKHAPDLRAAGVLELEIGDVKLTLAEPEPEVPDDLDDEKPALVKPLDDPDTFGGHVPRFQRPQRRINVEPEQ
jgi:hypothetical protein